MIEFYYIISQKPFYKSQPDSFIERKKRFYFWSRDPSLKITKQSQFDSGPVAMGRHFSKRNLSSFPTPQVEVLRWDKLSGCHNDWCHSGLHLRRQKSDQMRAYQGESLYTCCWYNSDQLLLLTRTRRGSRKLEHCILVTDSGGSVGSEQFGRPQLFFQDTCMILDAPCTRFCWKSSEHFEATDLSDKLIFKTSRFSKLLSLRPGYAFDKSVLSEFGHTLLYVSLWDSPRFLNK